MKKTVETYYCDICGKEIKSRVSGTYFTSGRDFPYMKPFKDDSGKIISWNRYDNLYVKDICEECHDKIAKLITSMASEENIGCDGSYRVEES